MSVSPYILLCNAHIVTNKGGCKRYILNLRIWIMIKKMKFLTYFLSYFKASLYFSYSSSLPPPFIFHFCIGDMPDFLFDCYRSHSSWFSTNCTCKFYLFFFLCLKSGLLNSIHFWFFLSCIIEKKLIHVKMKTHQTCIPFFKSDCQDIYYLFKLNKSREVLYGLKNILIVLILNSLSINILCRLFFYPFTCKLLTKELHLLQS